MSVKFSDMTPDQRKTHREFWLAWVERAQQELGALLAETIDETPAVSDTVYGCVNQLIDVEQQLSAVLTPEPQHKAFRWSRHENGHWSSNGYEIKRDSPAYKWRVLLAGEHLDAHKQNRPPNNGREQAGAPRPHVSVGLAGSNPAPDTKPCCFRLRFPSGSSGWCGLSTGHGGDHVALGETEIAAGEYGPKRAVMGCKR